MSAASRRSKLPNNARYLVKLLLGLWLSASIAGHAQTTTAQERATPSSRQSGYSCEAELLLAVSINGLLQPMCEHIAKLDNGQLAANTEALRHWRLGIPAVAPVSYEGESFYPLNEIPGLRYRLDDAAQELQLEVSPATFLPGKFNATAELQGNPQVSPGGFFNYDLLTQRSTSQTSNGLFEAGLFHPYGVGTSTFLWQNSSTAHETIRLESAWTHDDPETLSRLQLGDSISRAGTWGRAVRFGGLQWRSNFDTQPGFVTYPQPSAMGIAALPSTVDVYINNTQRFSQEVQPGPFEISNVPIITGAGEMQLVVKDMLGRQQVITQPYYASSSLLREGLDDYSYEVGSAREDYGLSGNHYGQEFAAATLRHGVSDRLTRELRAELMPGQQTAGLNAVYLWPSFGTAQAALAASHSPDGGGTLFMTGIEQIKRRYFWSMQGQISSAHFSELGWVSGNIRPRSTQSLRLGFPIGEQGESLSFNHLNQQYWGRDGNRIESVNYSRTLLREFYLLLFATQSTNGSNTSRSIGFNLSHSLGENISASAQINRQHAGNDSQLQIQKNLPEGPGFGYRLIAQQGLVQRQEAEGSWQTNSGTYSAAVSQQPGSTSTRLGASGGVAFLGGSTFVSRRIDDSFAVVKAGGYPDVRVYYENRPAGITDRNGQALIPHLRAYQRNRISVEAEDLPLEARIDQMELLLTPALRSGSFAEFPISTVRGGTLIIMLEDGSFIPPGARVIILKHDEEFPVGLRGEVFLPELAESNELLVTWKGQGCQFNFKLPLDSPPLADLGRHICTGVKP